MKPFDEKSIGVLRTQLPNANDLLPYLRKIDESGIYSNFGPLHSQLVDRLASYFGCEPSQIALVSNATVAISGVIQCTVEPGNPVEIPAWTFAATALAVLQSCRPLRILDLPDTLRGLGHLNEFSITNRDGGVAVAPFGFLSESLISLAARRQHVVIDAASCFDALKGVGSKLDLESSSPFIVSAHATKGFSLGEGGIILGSSALIEEVHKWSNFGFLGSRESQSIATNAKISEYSAAIGLASLDNWPNQRADLLRSHELYSHNLEKELQFPLALSHNMATLTYVVGVDPQAKQAITRCLREANIDYRDWWSNGLHKMQAFGDFLFSEQFPNTDIFASASLGLPFGVGFSPSEILRVTEILNSA